MTMREGLFTIPTRLFLTLEHRRKLEALVLKQGVDLPELITELVVNYLDQLPDLEPEEVAEPPPLEVEAELQQRKAELRRLRARLATEGKHAPEWIKSYIADLESEIARMEARR